MQLLVYATTGCLLAAFTWGAYSCVQVVRYSSPEKSVFSLYTLLSAGLLSLVATYVWVISLVFQKQPLLKALLENKSLLVSISSKVLITASILWAGWGCLLLFTNAPAFPMNYLIPTASYLFLFSLVFPLAWITALPLFQQLVIDVLKIQESESKFVASFLFGGLPLLSLTGVCLWHPESSTPEFYKLAWLSAACTANILLSIASTGLESHWLRLHGFSSYIRLGALELLHLFVTISNPLLPLFILMLFLTRISITPTQPSYLALLGIQVFFQTCFGLVWPVWHNIMVQKRLNESSVPAAEQMRFHAANYALEQMAQFCLVLGLCVKNLPEHTIYNASLNDQVILSILGVYLLFSLYFSAFWFCSDGCSTGCTRKLVYVLTFCFFFQYLSFSLLFMLQLPANYSWSFLLQDDSRFLGIALVLYTALMLCHLFADAPRLLYNAVYILPKFVAELEGLPLHQPVPEPNICFEQVLEMSPADPALHKHLISEVCAICINDLIPEDQEQDSDCQEETTALTSKSLAKVKNCGHFFHNDCIRGWLQHRSCCPIDRRSVLN